MSSDWRNSINRNCSLERLSDINNYFFECDNTIESPIDMFYMSLRDIIVVANPDFLENHLSMGPLLLVGIVSATENYFRDILSNVIKICPKAQQSAADQTINFGSVVWHSGHNCERGCFENISFAGSENVQKACRNYIKYELKKNGLASEMLKQYDCVCELRHCIVHSRSLMTGKNALKLDICPCKNTISIKILFDQLQECAAICTTLVVSFNTELFEEMCRRWAFDWPQRSSWRVDKINELFNAIWKIFNSRIDKTNATIVNPLSMVKCRNKIKDEYGII
jgi:hypothetical protein